MYKDPEYGRLLSEIKDSGVFTKIMRKKFIIIMQSPSISSFLTAFLIYNKARSYSDKVDFIYIDDISEFYSKLTDICEYANGTPLVFVDTWLSMRDLNRSLPKHQEVYFFSSQYVHLEEFKKHYKKLSKSIKFYYTHSQHLPDIAYREYHNTNDYPTELLDIIKTQYNRYIFSYDKLFLSGKPDLEDLYKKEWTLKTIRDFVVETKFEIQPQMLSGVNDSIAQDSYFLINKNRKYLYIHNSLRNSVNYDVFLQKLIEKSKPDQEKIVDAVVQVYYCKTYVLFIVTRLNNEIDLIEEFAVYKPAGDVYKVYIQLPMDRVARFL